MQRYICTEPLQLQSFDDDGFVIENKYMETAVGEIWTVEKQQYNIVASNDAVHLVKGNAWMEIHPDTLDAHFALVEGKLAGGIKNSDQLIRTDRQT